MVTYIFFRQVLKNLAGIPRGIYGKEYPSQCRTSQFNPWVGKIPWKRKRQPTPVFLPGKSHGQKSLTGYSPWGCKKLDMTEQLACTHAPIHSKHPVNANYYKEPSTLFL